MYSTDSFIENCLHSFKPPFSLKLYVSRFSIMSFSSTFISLCVKFDTCLIYINLSGSLFFVWCFLDLTMATMFLDVSRQQFYFVFSMLQHSCFCNKPQLNIYILFVLYHWRTTEIMWILWPIGMREVWIWVYRRSSCLAHPTHWDEWVSNCCLMPTQQFFSCIMARTS